VESDRDSVAQRAFPPVREGYDRDSVDAYLRALTAEVETLARASGALHDRVRALGGELSALTVSVRAGAEEPRAIEPPAPAPAPPVPALAPPASVPAPPASTLAPPVASAPVEESRDRAGEDLDGARLVALNLALGGESRQQADRYLAERFVLADRAKLLDEVYAAVEG
jgi:DivIVA domain-containing protein